MSLDFAWTITLPTPGSSGGTGSTGGGRLSSSTEALTLDPLGSGIVRPFRRTERGDFDRDSGVPEVLSCVGQVLGTVRGTFPWRCDFGSDLNRLRHKNNDPTLVDVARVMVDDALKRWEPRAQLVSVGVVRATAGGAGGANLLTISVSTRIGSSGKVQGTTVSV